MNLDLSFWETFASISSGLVVALLLVASISILASLLLGGMSLLTKKGR